MINTSTLISNVKGEFSGGNSLSVDWDNLIIRAVRNVLDNTRPKTLTRRYPLYGGIVKNVRVYYCPSDVWVPKYLYDNDGQLLVGDDPDARKYTYVPDTVFFKKQETYTFTTVYINGVRFLYVMSDKAPASLTIEDMEAVGTISGGTPTLDTQNYLYGSGSIRATFTDAGVEMGDTLDTAIDISDYLRGVVVLPAYIPTHDNLSTIEVRLKTDDSNYYSVVTSADSISDYLVDGFNVIRFSMQNATSTGSPDSTNIAKWSIVGTTTSGNTMDITVDRLTIQKSAQWYFEYISDAPFVDATTNALWQTSVSNADGDLVNFDNSLGDILHYELCMLVTQSSVVSRDIRARKSDFAGLLGSKYASYWERNPAQIPTTYSKSPEIAIEQVQFGGLVDSDDDDISTA